MRAIRRLFVHGFPSFYGGAGTELHHQISVWQHMGLEVHLIPAYPGYEQQLIYPEMLARGVKIHPCNEWPVLEPGDPVFGFCNAEFLENLHAIRKRTRRTVFLNCMTWLFAKEKDCMAKGEIAMFLYQNEEVLEKSRSLLRAINDDPSIRFRAFKPYFEHTRFPFVRVRNPEVFGCGRISRRDTDKFANGTLHVYNSFTSPNPKRGLFLGFSPQAEEKIGKPDDWIRIARDHSEVSQQEFYRHCEIVLQPTDTTENWPRIGFEAMASGSVLIVDNRGGWKQMIEHGKTGWLCDTEAEFVRCATRMASEPNQRADMAEAGRLRGLALGGLDASVASWEQVFDELSKLPE